MKSWILKSLLGVAAIAVAPYFLSQNGPNGADPATPILTPSTAASTEPPAVNSAVASVEIDNFLFKPKELHLAVGAKVTWVNKDDVPHTVTSSDATPVFDSKAMDTDDKFSFTFNTPGTYRYYCKVHPHMSGVVIVK